MNGKKTIVIICGTGIATSTVVSTKVETLCKKNRIPAQIIQGKAVEAQSLSENADLVVTTTPKLKLTTNVPVLNGIAFLNGIGEEELEASILKHLNS
ncbi:MAG: PTS sugar transporter subunit IIB [Anaerolineaceae bacterium]|nr:PTS sugar transporter subunit IIB [Anaerolineaceae bacterium]